MTPHINPDHIQEIIETDTTKTTILTQAATEEITKNLEGTITLEIEGGLKLYLHGFDTFTDAKGNYEAELYIKLNGELNQVMYAISNHKDADKVYAEMTPRLQESADHIGYQLIDMRALAAESIGTIKREKKVTTVEELEAVLEAEAKG